MNGPFSKFFVWFVGENTLSFLQSPSFTHFLIIIFKNNIQRAGSAEKLVFNKYEPLLGLYNMEAMTFILFCCHLSSQTDSLFII